MFRSNFARQTLLVSALMSGLNAVGAVSTLPDFETRALTGTDGPYGPGLGAGVSFTSFNTPVLNSAGQTSFVGSVTGTGVNFVNDTGMWSEGGGSGLDLIAREGNVAPGIGPSVNFSEFPFAPLLNSEGKTAFFGRFAGTGVTGQNDDGIWLKGGGSGLALFVREGNAAPGTGTGVNFTGFENLLLNDAGQIAFSGFLTGTGVTELNERGIWSDGGGAGLALIARSGNAAPGTGAGVKFSIFEKPVLNNAGQMAFFGSLTGTGVTTFNNRGIWSEGGGSGLALVARGGNAAPGTDAGVNFIGFFDPVINDLGQIAFRGIVTGTGVTSSNDYGIWSQGGGSGLSLIAREGDAAPGTGPGVSFSFLNDPVFNGAGQIAFRGNITGTGVSSSNNVGIWSESGGGGLALIAREGDAAPGTGPGVDFSALGTPVLNGAGQIAFVGNLRGAGVDSSNIDGIWATDRDGFLKLIVRQGDLFDVNEDPLIDELRTLKSVNFVSLSIVGSGNEDGRASGFNDLGQLVFRAEFTDGSSGIFVSNIVAIPEPSSVLLLSLAVPLFLRRRR